MLTFLLHLKLYQNFKNHHAGKLNKTYLMNMHNPQGLFSGTYAFKFSLNFYILWHDCEFIRKEYVFSTYSKISFMSSGDKPNLTLKISVTNFCRYRVNTLLLFSWVLRILNLYWNFKIFRHCHLLWIISVLFKWILSKVLPKRYKFSHWKFIFRS